MLKTNTFYTMFNTLECFIIKYGTGLLDSYIIHILGT